MPVTWRVETAKAHESGLADDLLQRVRERVRPQTVALDKGYDVGPVYEACRRIGAAPIIPLRQTTAVKRGDHLAPECEHGRWTFAGSDSKRGASKWRCPTGECAPKSHLRCPSCVAGGSAMPSYSFLGEKNLRNLAIFLEATRR